MPLEIWLTEPRGPRYRAVLLMSFFPYRISSPYSLWGMALESGASQRISLEGMMAACRFSFTGNKFFSLRSSQIRMSVSINAEMSIHLRDIGSDYVFVLHRPYQTLQ